MQLHAVLNPVTSVTEEHNPALQDQRGRGKNERRWRKSTKRRCMINGEGGRNEGTTARRVYYVHVILRVGVTRNA